MSACAAYLIATTQDHFALPRFTTFCIPLQQWPHHLLQMLRWEMRLRLTGRLRLRWRSLPTSDHLTPPPHNYTEANYRFNHSTPSTTAYYLWSNYTSRSTRLPRRHRCTTTLPTLNFSLHLHLKSINYSCNSKQLHFHNLTTHDPSLASLLETSGCHTTIPHCSAFHEAAYYHTLHTTTGNNSNYVITQLQIGQQLVLRVPT